MEPSDDDRIVKPKTVLELLPELTGILTKESMIMLTSKKPPRNTTAISTTKDKNLRPMTIAEMMPQLKGLVGPTPNVCTQPSTMKVRKPWNSSVKPDNKRTGPRIAKQNLKNSSVRKVLNFQPKPQTTERTPLVNNFATPKFKKPGLSTQLHQHQRVNNLRISGINSIAPTPINDNRKCGTSENNVSIEIKESNQLDYWNKKFPKPPNKQPTQSKAFAFDTLISNSSINSNNDTFLQKEKEINELEERITTITCDEQTLENIDEVSPPDSTPFTEYRSVQGCLNDISNSNDSNVFNDTIMCFDRTPCSTVNDDKEESMITSLCDLLNKAHIENSDPMCNELEVLLSFYEQMYTSYQSIMESKENHEKILLILKELIQAKKNNLQEHVNMSMLSSLVQKVLSKKGEVMLSQSIHKKSDIATKTLIKKNSERKASLRRTVLHKSMPSGLNEYSVTKILLNNKSPATSMYQQLKKSMNFLHTPKKERAPETVPDTPAITSQNVQKQLSKLYEN